MNCHQEDQVSASQTIEYIQFRLAGVHLSPENTNPTTSTETDQIIAHIRSRLRPVSAQPKHFMNIFWKAKKMS